ncbi:hypothetical protein [Burkholderia alba]|uniref:hypothetical protein n=1 Tax=Burkholderia alba TaxID=2683677 RepID=UPI002B055939|nr:hypothetical protein [Burkholderia alba]
MDSVEHVLQPALVNDLDIIDGARLITERAAGSIACARNVLGIRNPPLTLYGAYRQGVEDYFARRPNPYRAGSRFAAIWREGHNEASTHDA